MPDALFADFLMVDHGSLASASAPTRRGVPAIAGSPNADTLEKRSGPAQDAFAKKFAEALIKTLSRETASLTGSQIEPGVLAAALADIVAGRSVVLRLTSGASGHRREAVRTFLENVVRVTGTLEASRQEAAIAKLAEIILPDTLADARGALAADNLDLRDRFIAQTSPLTSAEVGVQAGHRSKNPYATAARWKKAGDLFSVQHRGTEYFPAFQFREGRPHPTIKKVLAALPTGLSPWQRALWFVSTNGWLGNKAPADLLDNPNAVVAAARREALEVIG